MASGCFDLLAADYDRTWTNSGIGRLQRDAVWRHMLPLFRPGHRVLDLGCGTGEDAIRLSREGVSVRALDASAEMVRIARSRGVDAEVASIECLDAFTGPFDGVISNFGALNCVEDLPSLRLSLRRMVSPNGYLVFCLMSRFCLMESLHYLRNFQFERAARRWSGHTYAARLGLRVFYPTAGQLERAMAPDFRLIRTVGIGLISPPSYVPGLSSPSLTLRATIDQRAGGWPLLRSIADHQLFIFNRSAASK